MTGILIIAPCPGGLVPGTVLLMQNVLLGQKKVMQIRQRETLSHQRAIIHEVCLSSAQLVQNSFFLGFGPMKSLFYFFK